MSPRAYTKRTESEGQDGAQAADKARPSSVQEAGVLVEPVFGQVKKDRGSDGL